MLQKEEYTLSKGHDQNAPLCKPITKLTSIYVQRKGPMTNTLCDNCKNTVHRCILDLFFNSHSYVIPVILSRICRSQ